MRALKTILIVSLALAWMPLAAHCQIEGLIGAEVLQCGPVDTGRAPAGSPCDKGFCCSWEAGHYLLPAGQPQVGGPLVAVLRQVLAEVTEDAPAVVADRVLVDTGPEPPRPWQFFLRAALPVRAPSLAS